MKEVAAGRSVFTVTSVQVQAVARAAGGGDSPLSHPKHRNAIVYHKQSYQWSCKRWSGLVFILGGH